MDLLVESEFFYDNVYYVQKSEAILEEQVLGMTGVD